MRVSANEHDPGHAIPWWRWAVIYLAGERINEVVTADEEQRAVVVYRKENGKLVVKDDRFVLRVLVGDVKIAMRADAPEFFRRMAPDRVEVG